MKVLKYYKLDVVPVLVYGHNIYGAPRSNAIYTILDGDGRANRIAHLVQIGKLYTHCISAQMTSYLVGISYNDALYAKSV